MDVSDILNNKGLQELALADKDKLLLELYKESFKKGNFDFITKGIAKNSEGKFIEGDYAKHEKQEEAFKILTNDYHEQFLYGGAAGGAKGLSINELVLTPFGFREIGKLKVGDTICSTDGGVQKIIKRYDNGVIPFYKLTFADGTELDCDYSHIWLSWKNGKSIKKYNSRINGESSMQKYTTEDMYKDFVKNGTNYTIPLTDPVVFNVAGSMYGSKKFVKRDLDPYTLGVLIGDGCIINKSTSFYSCDKEIAERIKLKYPELSFYVNKKKDNVQGSYNFIGKNKLFIDNYLRQVKLKDTYCYNKFIPKIYLHGSIQERWDLLNGLMDTDGYADENGNSFYTTTSKKLCDDFLYLVRSLGCLASVKIDKNTHYINSNNEKVNCKTAYTIRIKSKTPEKIFYLKRKKDRVKNKVHQSYGNKIVKIEPIENKKSICITVSNPNSLFITKNFIVTHNSWTGVSWIVFSALCYDNTKWFIARNELKDLKESVMETFKKVCRVYGISDYKFNAVDMYIRFPNGSHINLIEVKYKPSDPMYEDVGSTEYTSGWVEEIGEVHSMAIEVLSTRIGRHMNKEYGLKKKLFMTCNPKQNWAKTEFYEKHKNGTLYIENEREPINNIKPVKKIYLDCLVTENPFIEQDYIDGLRSKSLSNKSLYERLFKGNWDYEDNPYQLPKQEMIDQIFDNDHVGEGIGYITADVARFGSDKAVIGYWSGWNLKDVITLDISKTTDIELAIRTFRFKYKVPKNRVIIDQDGVGGGVVDSTGGIGFKNGGSVIRVSKDTPNFKNLQVQCLYGLADVINNGGLWVSADLETKYKEEIKQDLAQIQSKSSHDPERKLDCKSKGDIKQDIGRSPDWRDMIMMRYYFELKKEPIKLTTLWS